MGTQPKGSDKANIRRPSTFTPENPHATKAVKPPEQEKHVITNEDSLEGVTIQRNADAVEHNIPAKTAVDIAQNLQADDQNEPDPNRVETTNLETETPDDRADSRQLVREGKKNLSANFQPHPDPDLEAAKRD